MRVRLPLGRGLFFACASLFALAALLPLRLGLDWVRLADIGLEAREAEGSVWMGGLTDVRFGPIRLGSLQTRLRPFSLLLGRTHLDFRSTGNEELKGAVAMSRHMVAFGDLNGPLDVASLFAPLPLSSLNLDDVSIRYEDGLCVAAEGRVEANMSGEVAGASLPGGLSGTVRCDRGAALLPLVDQSGMVRLDLRLFGDGRHEAELALRPTDPAMAARLASAGLVPSRGGAYVLRVGGEI